MNSQDVIANTELEGRLASQTAPAAAADMAQMDRSLAHSIALRAVTSWASQILSWASLLIVVRLLAPADFGIAAMAIIIFPYLRYLSEIGIPATVVTFRDLSGDQLAQLNTIGLAFALGCFGIAVALAHPIAAFFRIPKLASVTIIACLALIPQGCRTVSEGLLRKDMRFGLISWFETIRTIVAAVSTLLLAYFGYGYWALILGNLLGTLVRSILIVAVRPHRFALPRPASIRRELRFGWHVLVSVMAWSIYERLDNLTAGRILGETALGFYGMAWSLANVPLEKITSLVTTTIPTYFAAVQNDSASLRRYLRALTEAIALATFPATIGMALVAREMVPVVMGNQWRASVVPLQILGVYAGIRSVVALLPKVLTSVGNARFVMWNDLRALVILLIAFIIGSQWGIAGIAAGWVVGYPLIAVPLYWKTFKTIGMSTWDYLRSLRPPLEATLLMALAIGVLKSKVPLGNSIQVRLVVEVAVGGSTYLAALFTLHRERTVRLLQAARSIRKRG